MSNYSMDIPRDRQGTKITAGLNAAETAFVPFKINSDGSVKQRAISSWLIATKNTSTTAEKLVASGTAALDGRFELIVQNLDSSVDIYIGNATVSATTKSGITIQPYQPMFLENIE